MDSFIDDKNEYSDYSVTSSLEEKLLESDIKTRRRLKPGYDAFRKKFREELQQNVENIEEDETEVEIIKSSSFSSSSTHSYESESGDDDDINDDDDYELKGGCKSGSPKDVTEFMLRLQPKKKKDESSPDVAQPKKKRTRKLSSASSSE